MWISRIRITGGFLSGLDLRLRPGLNVIIGPRGAGKTTLLELIGHAIGLSHAQSGRSAQDRDLVSSLLGTGEVIVDLESDSTPQQLIVDAEGRGRRSEFSAAALVIGQNELESIASDPRSRLRLIDLRANSSHAIEPDPAISTLTEHLASLREEIELLEERMRVRANLEKDREVLAARESALMSQASTELSLVRDHLALVEINQNQLRRDYATTRQLLREVLEGASGLSQIPRLLDDALDRPLPEVLPSEFRIELRDVVVGLADSHARLEGLGSTIEEVMTLMESEEVELRAQASPLRSRLEESEKGLGEVTAKLRNIDFQLSELDAAGGRLQACRSRYSELASLRDGLLDEFELAQEERYRSRTLVAESVSERLNNRIIIRIDHLTDSSDYRDLLLSLLQGSGMQFRSPAEAISRTTLPRQLLHSIESGESSELVMLTRLPDQRLARALAHLDSANSLSEIASTIVTDGADFLLRVGSELRSVEQLSTGQKCAVTLPILLTEHSRTLLLDQPEDHLDNAYLVETVVSSITSRVSAGAQTIIATHNANIPVLGNAEVVVSLNSDGRNGFISQVGRVDDPGIVQEITDIMEGGLDAFRARARFYNEYSH